MLVNLCKWASRHRKIAKSGHRVAAEYSVPSTVARLYDFREPGGYLGNVGLCTEGMATAMARRLKVRVRTRQTSIKRKSRNDRSNTTVRVVAFTRRGGPGHAIAVAHRRTLRRGPL